MSTEPGHYGQPIEVALAPYLSAEAIAQVKADLDARFTPEMRDRQKVAFERIRERNRRIFGHDPRPSVEPFVSQKPSGDHEIQEGPPCHLPQSAPPCVGCRCGADREEGGT